MIDRLEACQALSRVVMSYRFVDVEEERDSPSGKRAEDGAEVLHVLRRDSSMVEGQLPDSAHPPGEAPFHLPFRQAGGMGRKTGEGNDSVGIPAPRMEEIFVSLPA